MRKSILIMTALFAGAWASSAAVTVQGWWHYGEVPDFYADSSGNAHRFGSAFSRVGSGNAGVGVMPFGCGGPLGTTGYTSTNCLYWTPTHADAAGMWGPGYNPPANNYVIECWCLPEWPGTRGGNGAWLFCSGSSGGVRFQLTNDTSAGTMTISAMIVGNNVTIGDPLVVDTNHWVHLAIVNDNGTQTFYVNGVRHGASDSANATAPAGDIYGGSAPGTQPTFCGYLDELRISTFAPGAFSTSDLLTRAMEPNIVAQPQSASVWNGGAAVFTVGVAFDTTTTYQWRRGGVNISGATGSELYLNTVGTADSGAQLDCVLRNYTGLSKTTSVATLTVADVQTANRDFYRAAVQAEPSLQAYYTGDNDTGGTLTDIKGGHNGTLEGTAEFDGRADRAFGVRALRLRDTADGDVTIPNSPAFEFASGNGTVEAVVYLDRTPITGNVTLFSEAYTDTSVYYQIQVSQDGNSLIYRNDALTQPLNWAVPVSLLGRLAHVAIVFANNTVAAYVDGLPLGTKDHPSFGSATGAPLYIGSLSTFYPGVWSGSIDEFAVYGTALSANTIAIHNSRFLYGTNTTAPTITTQPGAGTVNLLAGGSPVFTVKAAGTAPLSYQWYQNGAPVPGATAATLTLSRAATTASGTYYVQVSNPIGSINSDSFILNFTAPADRYSTMVMGDNPSAFWRLDETSGTAAFDVAGGHNGQYLGSLTLGAVGASGTANAGVRFSGGNVEVPFSPALNPSGPFSIEFWAMPDEQTIYVPLSSQYRGGSARLGWCFYMENDADSWEIHLGNAGGVSYYCYGGGPVPLPGQFYHVVAVWDGAGNATLYSENQVVGHNTQVGGGGTYVPNASAPLEIGVRNGGSFPFLGAIDEVAIYNYALTEQQISNHWSIKFSPAAITTQPVGVTNVEGSTITLTAVASGFPNTYQWYKDGQALTLTYNSDNTAHYPQDVTNATLVISQATPADSGQYRLAVNNPLPGGGATTITVKVLVTNDLTPPSITSVRALGTPNQNGLPYLVKVLWSKRIDPNTGSYAIPGVTVNNVTLFQDVRAVPVGGDWREAILVTAGLTPGQQYTLNVSGVKDMTVSANQMAPANVAFHAPVLTQGLALWDYYFLGTGSGVASLTGNVSYPDAPMTNCSSATFDSTPITGNDLNNNPGFGATLGDNYGCSLSAWLTPKVSGNYTFFLASDDASELWLSTDASPQNLVQIAFELGCCHGFVEPTNTPAPTYTSQPIALTANTRYFIRALQIEGTGNDYVKVAWRLEGDPTPSSSLTPIPSAYLSSYASAPVTFNPVALSGGKLTISWNGVGTLMQSTNVALPMSQWTPVPGNPASPCQVTPAPGTPQMFYRLQQ